MKLTKLDKRYDGNERFTHRVEFRGGNRSQTLTQWVNTRNWLWEQYGPSAELFLARPEFFNDVQPKWAWDSEKSAIYLQQEALTMFLLKWESWQNGSQV